MTNIHFITHGCSANIADSEQMAGLLKAAKFELVDSLEEADVIIINTCTIKGRTEDKFFSELEELKKNNPYKIVIIAGCIAQTEKEKLKAYSLIGTKQIQNVVGVVEEALHDNVVHALEDGEMPPLDLPKIRKNPAVEIIPLSRGCLSDCTFCMTKHARGNLKSYPVEEIIAVAKKAVEDGVKEIWLTSQDNFCYGFDLRTNIVELLEKLVTIPGKFMIRVGTGNPVHLKKFVDELIPIMKHEKIFKFLHIPAQAGNDEVLDKMNRGNTDAEYRALIKKLQEAIPNITIATDIIVGFPGETEDHYWDTLQLVRETMPDVCNISRFWSRPGTPAAKMEQVPIEEIERRAKVLTEIFQNVSALRNERWQGWEGEIIIDEKGRDENQWSGRNEYYKPIIVEGDFKLGEIVKVKIYKTERFALLGKIME